MLLKFQKAVLSLSFISFLLNPSISYSQVINGKAGSYLFPGEFLQPNEYLNSPNGTYQLIYQTDGNLVIYDLRTRTPIWSSKTSGQTPNLVLLDSNGILRMYAPNWERQWSDGNLCNGGYLMITDNGEAVINAPNQDNKVVWGTKSGNIPYFPGFYPCYYR